MNLLKPLGHVDYTPVDQALMELDKYKLVKRKKPLSQEIPEGNPDFSLEDKTDHYLITGFKNENSLVSYKLFKELLLDKTQDEHAQDRIRILSSNSHEPFLGDISEYHSIFNILYNNKRSSDYKDIIEQARNFIKQSMLEHWLATLTRIKYNPVGDDIVMHNYKQSDQHPISIDSFIGPDGYITKPETANIEEPLHSLFNTSQNPEQINQVYRWLLTNADVYIQRLNSSPEILDEKVAGIGADSDCTFLDCDWYSSFSFVGLGVQKIFHKK